MKLRITEHFLSIQGEGKFVGEPSWFIRSFGCNLSCPGFGQDPNNMIPIEEMPHNKFDTSSVTSIEDLPVFPIGCDSSAAWSKKYAHLSRIYTVDELISEYRKTIAKNGTKPAIVITGGEPLLKKAQKFWSEFLFNLTMDATKHSEPSCELPRITFETNGTQVLTKELRSAICYYQDITSKQVVFSVSPKLTNSGEPWSKTFKPEAILSYWTEGITDIFFKFVSNGTDQSIEDVDRYLGGVADFVLRKFAREDRFHWPFDQAEKFMIRSDFQLMNFLGLLTDQQVFLMPEGGTIEGLQNTSKKVAELCMKKGYRYSPRLHIDLFGNSWGT